MAKHLSNKDIEAIISIIDGWSNKKITWDLICESSKKIVGRKPTRQALNNIDDIKTAYNSRKKGIKIAGVRTPMSANEKMTSDRIRKLESKVSRLTEQNTSLLEKFVVWQYNAYKRNLTEEMLNEPLPYIDRDRTED